METPDHDKQKLALFHRQVQLARSNAAGLHGGSKRDQNRKRRREGKQEAREN